jgi:Skp family chaperone for outer membrane proteins
MVGITLYSQDNLSVSQSNSEIVRIAYVNKAELLASIPQVGKIESELAQLEKDYEAEFVKMTKEY